MAKKESGKKTLKAIDKASPVERHLGWSMSYLQIFAVQRAGVTDINRSTIR